MFESSDAFIVKSDGDMCRECNCTDGGEVECNKKKRCKPVPGCIQYQESKTECCPPCVKRGQYTTYSVLNYSVQPFLV